MTLPLRFAGGYNGPMSSALPLKDKYSLARCCTPQPGDQITGYFSHDDHIKVHRSDCGNLAKAERARLVKLEWDDITLAATLPQDEAEIPLGELDLAILHHHRNLGVDYSLKVARVLNAERAAVFESHRRLRAGGLLERVEPTMIEYRKGIVPNKWIKHRNHTYYRLTERGAARLNAADSPESGTTTPE